MNKIKIQDYKNGVIYKSFGCNQSACQISATYTLELPKVTFKGATIAELIDQYSQYIARPVSKPKRKRRNKKTKIDQAEK